MSQKISIPVAASLDTSSIEQAVNAMGQRIAQANRVQYQPVSAKSVDDVKKLNSALNEVVKTQSGLRQRLKATGQESTPFTDWDWSRMYPHAASRGVAMQGVFERVVGGGRFTAPPPQQPPPGGGGGAPGGGGGFGGIAAGVAQAGLRATGPAGGVAAGAIGTGMSSGFGAGLMGLVGGIAALGVGKVVGSVMEKLDQAERNNVELDKLKRSLGDVAVSFGALKGVVHSSADNLKITYDEAARLSGQFAKLANLSGDQYKTLGEELGTGVGLSRSLGLDPAAGVGLLGQMRGLGITSNSQESRRFALLIGETIGKSNAFAKAEEVFEAIGGYAGSQTRNSMGAANVAGYAGMFSAMVGSGIPGLDPAGASGLLSKINSTLAAGGAKGEASQFFSGIVGHRMGLDPIQTQILREGGAFATNDEAFGEGSISSRFGISGPGGNKTFLQGSLDELRSQYGGNKGLLAQATANHLGIGMRQAMALLSLDTNQMGEMQQYAGDLTKISGSGITNLSKSLYGSAGDRRALADEYLGRRGDAAISKEDRAALEGASSDVELKRALAGMAAKYDQERTTGSDIRDSKNALDNIKTNLADKLVPIALEMRHGIMHMAGAGKKSPQEIMKEVLELESKDRVSNIKGAYENSRKDAIGEQDAIRAERQKELDNLKKNRANMTPEEIAAAQKRISDLSERYAHKSEDVRLRLLELYKKEEKALEDELKERDQRIKDLRKVNLLQEGNKLTVSDQSSAETARLARLGSPPDGAAPGRSGGYDPLRTDRVGGNPTGDVAKFVKEHGPLADKLAAQLGVPSDAILGQWGLETGWGRSVIKGTNNLGNIKDFSGAGPKARDNMTGSVDAYRAYDSTDAFGSDFAKLLGKPRYAGALGTNDPAKYFSGLKAGGYAEDPSYVSKGVQAAAMAARARESQPPRGKEGTPAASVGMQNESSYKPGAVTSAPLAPLTGEANVTVDLSPDAKRLLAAPSANMSMRVGPATPLGLKAPTSMRQ